MRCFWGLALRFFLVVAFWATVPAGAEGLRLVTGPDYPPFAGPDLPQGGMSTELVLAAFAAAGRAVESVEYLPWKRGYEAVLDGSFDATFPYLDAPSRQLVMRYSTPISMVQVWPVFRADRMRSYAGPASLIGLILCEPVGYVPPPELQPLIDAGQLHLVQPATMQLCARQLLAGRVDLMLNSPVMFETIVSPEWHGGPEFKIGDRPVAENPLSLLVGRQNPQGEGILADLARGFERLRAEGRYDEIVHRHLDAGSSTQ